MPLRDSQRTKFNTWNIMFCAQHALIRVPLRDVTYKINAGLVTYGCPFPKYKHILRSKSRYRINTSYEISLPIWSYKQPDLSIADVCILIGWCVFLQKYKNTESWHGPTFCKVYAESLSKFTGIPVQDIIDSMLASNLKVSGTAKVGARILKKHEKLKNRVQELDAAIKRGRDEFELFLQPILGELEKTRLELEALEKTIYY